MAQYLKHYIWEYIVCVLACGALLLNTAQGFYIPDRMADSLPLAFGACAVLLFCFYLLNYNKISVIIGLVIALILVCGAFLVLRMRGVDIVDAEGSRSAWIIYWFLFAIICIFVFFASRFRVGVILVFLLGICVSALMEYLHFESKTWTTALFCISCILLFLLRQFRHQSMNSSTADPKFGRFAAFAAVLVVAAALIGTGVYYAAIKPANPPTLTVKLFERYVIYDLLQVTGIADDYPLYGVQNQAPQDNDTDEDPDSEEETIDAPETPEGATRPDVNEPQGAAPLTTLVLEQLTPRVLLMLLFLLILVIAVPPLVKQWLRKRRMKQLAAMENAAQMKALYRFYLQEFAVLGWSRNRWETPEEYVERCAGHLQRFLTGTCGLETLTKAFIEVNYAEKTPDDAACAQVRSVYPQLLKNSKKQLGFVRYAWKYYVL